ncbi:hypothetical protein [Velocimicrobium porci]|uniref:Zinc-finger domain-containing protein n=1 Tax=Velocimicrobium porci TaxID=2606634 RepID=A0A6L5XWZ8_9FIRM|nr:hypothetical protein [Velocimicrobium porci]MSS63370.1 hypothetical protein [Velocimicrobium porci]
MDCKETQANIELFVKDKLDVKKLKEFLYHVEQCEECMDELEVYFTLYSGMQILEKDKDSGIDYRVDLKRKLRKGEETLRNFRLKKFRKILIFIVFILLIAIFL